MKYIHLLLLVWLLSCNSSVTNDKHTVENSDYKKQVIDIPFSGCWIDLRYYKKLKETQSPKEAQAAYETQFIVIPDSTLQKTVLGYNFHEGIPCMVLKNRNEYELWETINDTLYKLKNTIEFINDTCIKIENVQFVKISPVITKGSEKIIEEMLFKGVYTDAFGKTVEFKSNGELIGIDDINYFSPLIDYFDAGMQVDQIGMGKTEKDIKYNAYRFNADTLFIHDLECVNYDSTFNTCNEVAYGDLKYKLWKKR